MALDSRYMGIGLAEDGAHVVEEAAEEEVVPEVDHALRKSVVAVVLDKLA